MIDHVVSDFLNEEMVEQILSDPKVEELVTSISQNRVNESTLPFSTKEEGVKVILSKFSIAEMTELATQVQGGLSSSKQKEIIATLEERLTPEELDALMYIGIAELQREISSNN